MTADTITSAQIRALRDEAGSHGDLAMVAVCSRALPTRTRPASRCARAECARVIAAAMAVAS